jgi:CO/xanthine dehydrogenase FAD-binding subunit
VKPAGFAYHRPATVADAVAALHGYGGSARVLAGGQSLVPMLNMRLWRPAALVDINDIDDLDDVRIHADDVEIGALVRYSTVERSASLGQRLPLLTRAVRSIGDRQVRNRGTVCGSLVHADPTAEMPLVCLALDAVVVAVSTRGVRQVPVAELYEGSYATVLDPDELVVAVRIPAHPTHWVFHEVNRKHNDFAVLAVVVTGEHDPRTGTWSGLRVALGGVADTPLLAQRAMAALEGTALADDDLDAAVAAARDEIDPPSDVRASAEYRRHLLGVHLRRVLAALRRRGDDPISTPRPAPERAGEDR